MSPSCSASSQEHGRRPVHRIADIVRSHLPALCSRYPLNFVQRRLVRDIARCRTAALGGHVDVCVDCGHRRPSYNSCRNRHCAGCLAKATREWLEKRMERALPVGHYHVVVTLPAQLRALTSRNRKLVYQRMFEAAAESVKELCADRLGILPGITAVLHSWSRELVYHPHIHMIVTAGGLRIDGPGWKDIDPDPADEGKKFLLPKDVVAALFRGKLLAKLRADLGRDFVRPHIRRKLYRMRWNAYIKEPFTDRGRLYKYLSLYTHRVALSDYRLVEVSNERVTFRTRGDGLLSLEPLEFLKRFTNHWLPRGFTRIRHYGLYASRNVPTALKHAHGLLADRKFQYELPAQDPDDPELLEALVNDEIHHGRICERCDSRNMKRQRFEANAFDPAHRPRAPP